MIFFSVFFILLLHPFTDLFILALAFSVVKLPLGSFYYLLFFADAFYLFSKMPHMFHLFQAFLIAYLTVFIMAALKSLIIQSIQHLCHLGIHTL